MHGKVNITDELGKRIFPDSEQGKGRKLTIRMLAGFLLTLFSILGIEVLHMAEKRELRKYEEIAKASEKGTEEGKESGPENSAEETKRMPGGITRKSEIFPRDVRQTERSGGLHYDWDVLSGLNDDIRGWLFVSSFIDFPVVKTADNDFYLTHDFFREISYAGCLFMDKDTEITDFNYVIYGHNMGKDSQAMFSTLLYYKSEEYFNAHSVIYFADKYGYSKEYKIMAVIEYNTGDVAEWDFRTRDHGGAEERNIWLEQMKGRALYFTEPEEEPEKILTLATCDRSKYGKNGRLIVMAYTAAL